MEFEGELIRRLLALTGTICTLSGTRQEWMQMTRFIPQNRMTARLDSSVTVRAPKEMKQNENTGQGNQDITQLTCWICRSTDAACRQHSDSNSKMQKLRSGQTYIKRNVSHITYTITIEGGRQWVTKSLIWLLPSLQTGNQQTLK